MKRRVTLTAHGMATVVLNAGAGGGITWEVDAAHDAIAFDDRTAKLIALGEAELVNVKLALQEGGPLEYQAAAARYETARAAALEADRAATDYAKKHNI